MSSEISRNAAATAAPAIDRDALVREHMGLVHQTVERICGSVARSNGSFDDLVSAGMVGLLNAMDAFDASRGVAFSTYAHPRVRGAVLDELRRQDSVPRSIRRKRRVINRARDTVSSRTGQRSSEREVAAELGVDIGTLWRWDLDSERGQHESLDSSPVMEAQIDADAADGWTDSEASPDTLMEVAEQVDSVRAALAALPEQERLVLILYFYEELKLRQIGDIMGVTESRVSQIRTQALKRLRGSLATVAA